MSRFKHVLIALMANVAVVGASLSPKEVRHLDIETWKNAPRLMLPLRWSAREQVERQRVVVQRCTVLGRCAKGRGD